MLPVLGLQRLAGEEEIQVVRRSTPQNARQGQFKSFQVRSKQIAREALALLKADIKNELLQAGFC